MKKSNALESMAKSLLPYMDKKDIQAWAGVLAKVYGADRPKKKSTR
jgi:hypothetical protein